MVGLQTWLWVDEATWRPFTATASAGGLSATVTATPVGTEWEMGDGTTVTCDGPGTPYTGDDERTDCGHVYQVDSAGEPDGVYDAAVTIVWSVTWTASNGEGGDLGAVERTTRFPVDVGQRQAGVEYS
jgi:hypothetical protein